MVLGFPILNHLMQNNDKSLIGVTKHPNYLPLVGYLTVRIFTPSKTTFERMK